MTTRSTRAILANIFEADYAILEAENGAEGWQWIRAHADALSAVLLDVVMPEMNGLELMRHLAQEGFAQKTPVFLITGRMPATRRCRKPIRWA